MQYAMGAKSAYLGLDGIIQFQQSNDTIECVVSDITEDYTEAMIVILDPCVYEGEDLDLSILVPAERSPIKCIARIVWPLKDDKVVSVRGSYLARVSITHISKIDRRRLDFIVSQKKAFVSGGFGLSTSRA